MAPKKGNKHAVKLKTPELKKAAYDSYCAHLAKGKNKKSWYFEHPDLMLTWQTMEKYISEEPNVFNPLQKEMAWSKGYQHWEGVVEASAEGTNKEANTASLQMLMRNKYGWDKQENTEENPHRALIKDLADYWRNK